MTLAGGAGDQAAGGAGEGEEDGGGGGRGGRPGGKVGQRCVIHLQIPISTNILPIILSQKRKSVLCICNCWLTSVLATLARTALEKCPVEFGLSCRAHISFCAMFYLINIICKPCFCTCQQRLFQKALLVLCAGQIS